MKQNLKIFILFLLSTVVFVAYTLVGNNRQRNLQSTVKTATFNPNYGSTSSKVSDVASSTSGNSGKLSTGAQAAIYACSAIGLFLILVLINYAWRRYRAYRCKQAREKCQQEIQNLKNAQQQNHQMSQNLGNSTVYNPGQQIPNMQRYPQNYQFQVYPNQNNQNFY
ncbi:transmembrane protein, putative (macronuclear) [Tetrahymena thermophila SB210]|uniref:Transmembrane protein, putative n=1 Tax=Tetrahymena thermophila (strain SB210) TaxID=312017 RepID=Q23F71_TETTS|nr:transmembrane protein, putative [Tetrahymena thermophila SB210]EAR95282.2 transmembrane protein, putative [Tetrahymena thermophila SB210]|eukprot:XP_001015527.2 transmembrane protein, putative [Tetrahymena thermophila SB210]